ncbi:MAG: prepilin peptidase [Sulfurimonadaceae bacterium]|jgi:leader peptidase (prepilin peptidase)/N-methyltransferase|nr:prepilin peptidase [Sulfurimonadaceae bacterium]
MEMILVFIFGTLFGSFLNVVILRIPKDESVVFGASHCYTCHTALKPWHNIPLFSWLFLRGKCGFCKTPISAQYPIIEFLSGLIFMALVFKYGVSLPLFMIALSFLMLLALSMIDFRYKMVPDSLNLLAIIFAILGAWSFGGCVENLKNAFLLAGGFTLLRFSLSYILTASARREAKKTTTVWSKNYHTYPFIEAMGEGDIMVAATMGALLGVPLALVAIFLSALLALPVMLAVQNKSAEEQRVPFVPFLALGTFIVFLFDMPILEYLQANF